MHRLSTSCLTETEWRCGRVDGQAAGCAEFMLRPYRSIQPEAAQGNACLARYLRTLLCSSPPLPHHRLDQLFLQQLSSCEYSLLILAKRNTTTATAVAVAAATPRKRKTNAAFGAENDKLAAKGEELRKMLERQKRYAQWLLGPLEEQREQKEYQQQQQVERSLTADRLELRRQGYGGTTRVKASHALPALCRLAHRLPV